MPLSPYAIDSARLLNIVSNYKNFNASSVSYATVRDFSDGVTHLPELATISKDLKDAQRAWMLKMILGTVPVGARLLEIGAGDPHVVHWLTNIGYEVVVVDPYDGSGHGPTDYEIYKKTFPQVEFIRENFSDDVTGLMKASFDSIYSISVLEHIPHPILKNVMNGIRRYQKPRGITIHAVDHVLAGCASQHHLKTLNVITECLGLAGSELDSMLCNATDDPDTYFLSAESHNMWRGSISYDDFPMRRCISVQFAKRI